MTHINGNYNQSFYNIVDVNSLKENVQYSKNIIKKYFNQNKKESQ